MKMMIAAVAMIAATTSAWAGCANYEDGSTEGPAPRATVCVGQVCEETTTAFQCGNINGAQYGYANGLQVVFDKDGKASATLQAAPVDPASLKCTEIDADACFPAIKG